MNAPFNPNRANLTATVSVCWEDTRGVDRDVDVEVEYTFDGDDLRIISSRYLGAPIGIGEWELDELIWEAVNEQADEAYLEWQHDRGDWLYEQARDRAAESYVPAGSGL